MAASVDIFKGKVLIVDDQRANVLLLEKMLRDAGYVSVTSTMDSGKVCELHLTNRYDLILLDLEMPEMNGFQVMENLKEIEAGSYLPVLVITAHREEKLRALKAGAKDFVGKPFEVAEVLIRVHNMLEVRMLYLETKRLYDRVVAEQKVSERFLLGALPHSIVESLKLRPEVITDGSTELVTGSWAEVTVLFADIVAFTEFSEGASAEVLVGVLNDLSTRFGGLGEPDVPERSRTISEAHLATVGLSDALANQTIRAANKALDLADALDRFNDHSHRYKLKVRVGIDARAGVAAKRNRKFDL